MELAKTRKNGAVEFISRHLLSSAHQALSATRQTVVAKLLNIADSTVLRRTEKYPELMDNLAASGVKDFVMEGEKKIPIEEYRWLLRMAMELARIQLDKTDEEGLAA
ncbi:hypothetical protein A8A01_03260 [Ewingella americana]|nr:hypothetical protein A8A01_03260 [Ewingella americana]